jgi:hypothetical protein
MAPRYRFLPAEVLDSLLIGERGQAELSADLLQPSHQECAQVHPLLDRAERGLDRLALPFSW